MYSNVLEANFFQRTVFMIHFHLFQQVESIPASNDSTKGSANVLSKATYLPNIVYLPSRWPCFAYVMKNCDPFVLGPEFAIDTYHTIKKIHDKRVKDWYNSLKVSSLLQLLYPIRMLTKLAEL